MRKWSVVDIPLIGGGEQSSAAPLAFAGSEMVLLRNAVITGPGIISQQPDILLADTAKDLETGNAALATFTGGGSTALKDYVPDLAFGKFDLGTLATSLLVDVTGGKATANSSAGTDNIAVCENDVTYDRFDAYADITRANVSNTPQNVGFLVRSNGQTGGTADHVYILADRVNDSLVNLQINKIYQNATIQAQVITSNFAWAKGAAIRLGCTVLGSVVTLWTEPSGGGTKTTQGSLTLSGSGGDFNDTSHMRFGLRCTQYPHSWDNYTVVNNPIENDAVVGIFPFETQGGATFASQGVIFSENVHDQKVYVQQMAEDLTLQAGRRYTAYSSYTQSIPPQITGFPFFGKFVFCEYARQVGSSRKGLGVFDPASTGTITIPNPNIEGAGAHVLGFRGIAQHRGATVIGWGYRNNTDTDRVQWIAYQKYGADPSLNASWVADTSESTAGGFDVGTIGEPIVACATAGQYTILGKEQEIFVMGGDYSSQFFIRQIGNTFGPVSTAGMVSIGDAAVWMSAYGPAISEQGTKPTLLTVNKAARRMLSYMDLLNTQAAHDKANTRVLFGCRRQYDDDGVPVSSVFLTDILWWDYIRNQFGVMTPPGQFWALGTTKGPGLQLAGPIGTVSALAASGVGQISATITWTPGDTAPDVTFLVNWRVHGASAYTFSTTTASATYTTTLTGLTAATVYDVEVAQVRNGQTSAYTESLSLFTTSTAGAVDDPTSVVVSEYSGTTIHGVLYGLVQVTWDAVSQGAGVTNTLFVSTTNDFATASAVVSGLNPNAGIGQDPTFYASGTVLYYWLRQTNLESDVSNPVPATPTPLTIVGGL